MPQQPQYNLGTPNNLDILIHFCVSSGPHPRQDAPAVEEGIRYLVDHGLLDRGDFPRATDRGRALLNHLLRVPFPVISWVIPAPDQDYTDA